MRRVTLGEAEQLAKIAVRDISEIALSWGCGIRQALLATPDFESFVERRKQILDQYRPEIFSVSEESQIITVIIPSPIKPARNPELDLTEFLRAIQELIEIIDANFGVRFELTSRKDFDVAVLERKHWIFHRWLLQAKAIYDFISRKARYRSEAFLVPRDSLFESSRHGYVYATKQKPPCLETDTGISKFDLDEEEILFIKALCFSAKGSEARLDPKTHSQLGPSAFLKEIEIQASVLLNQSANTSVGKGFVQKMLKRLVKSKNPAPWLLSLGNSRLGKMGNQALYQIDENRLIEQPAIL